MADGVKVKPSNDTNAVRILSDEVVVPGGFAQAQQVKIGHGDDGDFVGVGPTAPLPTADSAVLAAIATLAAALSGASDQAVVDALAGTLLTSDASPPLVPIGPGGLDVPAGQEVQLVPAVSGRVKLSVNHRGVDGSGDVWLGFGQTASAGTPGSEVGEWIEPGGRWEDFYAGAVRVRNTGASVVRVTWMEWGA